MVVRALEQKEVRSIMEPVIGVGIAPGSGSSVGLRPVADETWIRYLGW
jgi:hypothetical protein